MIPAMIKNKRPKIDMPTKPIWKKSFALSGKNCRPSNNTNRIKAKAKFGNQYKKTSLKTKPEETKSPVERKITAIILTKNKKKPGNEIQN